MKKYLKQLKKEVTRMNAQLTQEVFEPKTIDEATKILLEKGSSAKIISGGTDVIVQAKDGVFKSDSLVDIIGLPLSYIKGSRSKGFTIGATTTAADIRRNVQIQNELPVLYEGSKHLGGPQTQELATIGGNVCNASPCGNLANVLLSLNAGLKLVGPEGEREVALENFFGGPGKTVLKPAELLTEIIIPAIPDSYGASYIKHAPRKEMDIAVVGVGVLIIPEGKKIKSVRIALSSVGPKTLCALKAQKVFEGNEYSLELVEEAAKAAQEEASYIDDVRSSADYRRKMTYVLVKNMIVEAWGKSQGGK
jgi:CO/xanthine dehydrogenase FAD-binding subunit